MDCQQRLKELLSKESLPFELQHHPVAYTAQAVAQSEHVPGRMLAKVVMAVADGKLAMFVLPAPAFLNLAKAAAAAAAAEVRLAREDEFQAAFPDCEVGAMPPIGNLYGVPTYVDQALADLEDIVFQAGSHTETIRMKFADYVRVASPVVSDVSGKKRSGRGGTWALEAPVS